MNKIIEIATFVLGGLSLFAVCFLGFAVMSGVPMERLPVVGKFFEESAQPERPVSSIESASTPSAPVRQKSDSDIVESSVSVLQAWSLPSPFSASELNDLADELKARTARLDQWEHELETAEQTVGEDKQLVADQREALTAMQARLESYERELSMRAQEVERGEQDASERVSRHWGEVAGVFENGDLEGQAAASALAEYEPEEAARILRHMDAATASGLLAELLKIEGTKDRWKEYVEAYSALPQAKP